MTQRPLSLWVPPVATSAPAEWPTADAASGAQPWLGLLCVCLAGYATFGKAWAYVGIAPVYVGEIVLLCGAVAALVAGKWHGIFDVTTVRLLVALAAWGAFRTVPFFSTYGADALRDAAVWGYGAYAVVVFAYLAAVPQRLPLLLRRYRQFIPILLCGVSIVVPVAQFVDPAWRWWPASDQPIKGADVLVQLAGVVAFWSSQWGGPASWVWLVVLTLNVAFIGLMDRSGLVSFLAVLGVCFALSPRSRTLPRIALLTVFAVAALWLSGLRIELQGGGGKTRELSFDFLVASMRSVTSDVGDTGLDSTKEWRLDWWGEIVDYTLGGRFFWTGKGFGVNLADDDGFQVSQEHALRSPHSVHMTFLARAGVPGLVLWLATQLAFGAAMWSSYLRARRRGDDRWAGVFLFLGAFWMAFLINGSFDVFIEGPVGGIWFWTIFGAGLAAARIYRVCPQVLFADEHHRCA